MATPGATILNIGSGGGQNHFQLDYSATTGGGIITKTQAQLTTFELANVYYLDDTGSMCMLRSDVDVDVIASNGYPRTEHRELATDGTTLRAFNPTTGDHWCQIFAKPVHLPPFKPSVVLLQMHDNLDDIIEIAVQPRSDFATTGKLEVVVRINGTSLGIPRLVTDYVMGTWLALKLRVGAIMAGSTTGWEAYCGNLSVPAIKSTDSGMPAMSTSGANSYFKTGCYLQTKWTGSGTGGLETDRNEYGLVGFREWKTSHNGETAPTQLTFGTDSTNAISNVRWGTKAEGVNTAGTSFTVTPALPASLVADDMVYIVARSRRTNGSTVVSNPTIEVSPVWTRIIDLLTNVPPGDLLSHSQKLRVWVRPWFSGMAAPVITYTASTTTDIMSAQCFAIAGGKLGEIEAVDQAPSAFNLGASSTTVLGPTAALPANCRGGALALALLANEFNVPSGAASIVTGTDSPALTWLEGGEGIGTTISFQAWANDYALVPAGAGQPIVAKSALNTARTTGKSASILMTLRPSEKRASGMIPTM